MQIAKPDVVLRSRTRKCIVFSMDSSLSPLGAKPTALGKDEVGGSNPPSSSRKSLKSYDFGDFSYFFGRNGVGQNVGQLPDPHRDPHVEMCGKV